MANQDRWRTDRDDDRFRDEDDRSGYSGDYPRGGEDRGDWSRGQSGYGRGSGWEGAAGGYGRGREFESGGRSFGGSSGRGGSFGGLDFERDSSRGGGRSPAGGTDWEGGTSYRGGASGRSDWDRAGSGRYESRGNFGQGGSRDFGGGRSATTERSYSGGRTGSSFGDAGRYDDTSGLGGYGRSAYGRNESGYGRNDYGRNDNDRGFFEKAADEVSSWFGDDDAERRREQDHKGRGPKGYSRSDDRIREDVSDKLTDDWRVDASDITVEVASGEITLTGTVNNRDDKRRAEDIAERVAGVKHVQNNLRVNQQGSSWSGSSRTTTSASGVTGTSYGAGSSATGTTGTTAASGSSADVAGTSRDRRI